MVSTTNVRSLPSTHLIFLTLPRQTAIQHQTLEDLYRLLQLPIHRRYHRREDFHHARQFKPRPAINGVDTTESCDQPTSQISVSSATSHGLTPTRTGWSENDRGVSFTLGSYVVSCFLQKHDMETLSVGHIESWRTGTSSSPRGIQSPS